MDFEILSKDSIVRQNEAFTNINSETVPTAMSGGESNNCHVQNPGNPYKDKKRVRQYISSNIKDMNITPAQIRGHGSSNYFSYNMCNQNNSNRSNSITNRNVNNHKAVQSQKTVFAWETNVKASAGNTDQPRTWDRKVSMFSHKAFDARKFQVKQKPLINNNKNQPMQHLFKFWNQMKTTKTKNNNSF